MVPGDLRDDNQRIAILILLYASIVLPVFFVRNTCLREFTLTPMPQHDTEPSRNDRLPYREDGFFPTAPLRSTNHPHRRAAPTDPPGS
jgi:hypothetical protein